MKQCPQCKQAYLDETLNFCLVDGSPLVGGQLAEDPTIVSENRGHGLKTDPQVAPVQDYADRPAANSSVMKYVAFALGALMLLVIGGLAALMIAGDGDEASNAPANANSELAGTSTQPSSNKRSTDTVRTPQQSNAEQSESAENAEPRPAKTPVEKEQPPSEEESAPEREPTPEKAVRDGGTTRLVFGKGKYGGTYRGTIASERSYSMWTLDGQNLSATVRSPGGCVTFADGGTSTGYTTSLGRSIVTLRNRCDSPTSYAMSVTVR